MDDDSNSLEQRTDKQVFVLFTTIYNISYSYITNI